MAAPTWAWLGISSAATTGGTDPAYPASGVQSGDIIYCRTVNKAASGTGDPPTLTAPTGWTEVLTAAGGTGTAGIGTGLVRVTIHRRDTDADGTENGTTLTNLVTVAGNVCQSNLFGIRRATAGSTIEHAFSSGADTTTGTDVSVSTGSNPGIQTDDLVLGLFGSTVGAAGSTFSAESITATGATLGAVTEREDSRTTSGFDIAYCAWSAACTAGSSSGNPSIAATCAASTSGAGVVWRIREITTTIWSADASVPATGTISAAGQLTQQATSTVPATGTISAAATQIQQATATVTATGGITAAGAVIKDGAATVSATGSIAATALVIRLATGTIPATGSISADATVIGAGPATILADATIPATSSIAAVGTVVKDSAATVQATGTITAAALIIQAATATIPATGTIVGQAVQIRVATAQVTAAGTITASGILVQRATATVSATATINAVAVVASPLPEVGTWDTSAGSGGVHEVTRAALSAHDATGHTSGTHETAGAAQAAHEAAGTLVGTHEGT